MATQSSNFAKGERFAYDAEGGKEGRKEGGTGLNLATPHTEGEEKVQE